MAVQKFQTKSADDPIYLGVVCQPSRLGWLSHPRCGGYLSARFGPLESTSLEDPFREVRRESSRDSAEDIHTYRDRIYISLAREPRYRGSSQLKILEAFDRILMRSDHSTGSAASLEICKFWLKTCNEDHQLCWRHPASTKLPSRLINVGGSNVRSPFLADTAGKHGQYVALSHC